MEPRRYKVNESLSMAMGWEFANKLFVGKGEQKIGSVTIELDYKCDKLLGKCIDEGRIVPEVSGAEDIAIIIDIERFEFSGKLKGSIKEGTNVELEVGMGRGPGKMTLAYVLKTKSLEKEGRYTILLTIYYETEKGERKILGEPIHIDLHIVKPFIIEQFLIEPGSEYYTIGDPLKLTLKILSEYDGIITVECGGAIKQEKYEYKVEKGSKVISIDTSITSPKDELSVFIKAPTIKFDERIIEKINVKDQRVSVELVEVSDARLGKEASISIKLTNLSKTHHSHVDIAANIYGYHVKTEEDLSPSETKIVQLGTPILTIKSCQHLKGEISVVEKISGQKTVLPLELAEPSPLPVELKIHSEKIEIPTNTIGKIEIYVHNDSDLDINIVLTNISSKLCSIQRNVGKTIAPYGFEVIDVEVKPLSLGNEKAVLSVGIAVNDIIVEERTIEFEVEVKRSFNIKEVKVLYPSKTMLAVKNQRIDLEIKIEVPYGKVDLVIRSPNIVIENQHYQVHPPETTITVSGKAIDYCEGIKIYLGDGLIEEEIAIPINVRKPLIEYEILRKSYYVGVRDVMTIRLANPFEVPLDVEVGFEKKTNIEVDKDVVNIHIEQLSKKEVMVNVTGLSRGVNLIRIKIISSYVDETSKAVVDTWIHEQDVELEFDIPISIEILDELQNKIPIPYPLPSSSEVISTFCNVNMLIKNNSDIQLPEVSIEPQIIEAPGSVEIQPKILALPPRGKEKIRAKVVVPANYRGNVVKVQFNVKIGKHTTVSRLINLPVNKYLYSIVEIDKESFDDERCIYPRIYLEGRVYTLVPVTENENICGKPLTLSAKNHAILKTLYTGLNKVLKTYESPWEIVASIVFKKITEVDADYKHELKILSTMQYYEEGITIIPALLWALAIQKTIGYPVDEHSLAKFLNNMKSIGLLYVENSPMYKVSKNTFYHRYLRFAINKDDTSATELYNLILESIKNEKIDPLYLLYILYEGKHIQHSQVSEVIERLFEKKKYDEFLICLVLTDISITNNIDILAKLEISLNEILNLKTIRRSTVLTLSLLLRKIILENMKNILEKR